MTKDGLPPAEPLQKAGEGDFMRAVAEAVPPAADRARSPPASSIGFSVALLPSGRLPEAHLLEQARAQEGLRGGRVECVVPVAGPGEPDRVGGQPRPIDPPDGPARVRVDRRAPRI